MPMFFQKAHVLLTIAFLAGGRFVDGSNPSGSGISGGGTYPYARSHQQSQDSQWYARSGHYDSQQQQQQQQAQQQPDLQADESAVEGDDEPLPPGWSEHFDPASGQMYYYNSEDGTTTWDRPASARADESPIPVQPPEVEGDAQSLAYQEVVEDRGDQPVDESRPAREDDKYGDVDSPMGSFRREDSNSQEDPQQQQQEDGAGWDSQPAKKAQAWEMPPPNEGEGRTSQNRPPEEWRNPMPNSNQDSTEERREHRDSYGRDDTSQPYGSFQQNPTPSAKPHDVGPFGVPREAAPKPAGWGGMPGRGQPGLDKHGSNGKDDSHQQQQQPMGHSSPDVRSRQPQYPPTTDGTPSQSLRQQQGQEETRSRLPLEGDTYRRQQPYRPEVPIPRYHPQSRPGSQYAPQNPYAQYPPYGQGSVGGGGQPQQPYRPPQGQLVPQQQPESEGVVKEALSSAWRGILGFGNRTRDVVGQVGETVASSASTAGQSISSTSAGLWGQAKSSIGSVFESGEKPQTTPYSLSGQSNSRQQEYRPDYPQQRRGYPPQQKGYPPNPRGYPPQQGGGYPPQQGGNPPQQGGGYPPQRRGYPPQQRTYPPQSRSYPPRKDQEPNTPHRPQPGQQGRQDPPQQPGSGRGPPDMQPRRDQPYPNSQYRSPPMQQTQWGSQGYAHQSYQGGSRGMGPPQGSQSNQPQPGSEEQQDAWSHPGLQSDY